MTQWVITSSLLILVIVLLRYALKGKISLRLQYALWVLVLIRLLVPVSFGSSRVSVMNVVDRYKGQQISDVTGVSGQTSNTAGGSGGYYEKVTNEYEASNTGESLSDTVNIVTLETKESIPGRIVSIGSWLYILWLTGAAAVGLWLMIVNLGFALRLKRTRRTIDISSCPLKVYSTDTLDTSCLFGLLHPAIYISKKDLESELVLNYVLEHEITHFRHLDHVWSFLRCLCMAVHWYNPLVWWAASLSKQDAELACDEATIRKIGEDSRSAYGRTLIELTCNKRRKGNLMIAATTMSGSKKRIKERITMIAQRPRMAFYTFILVFFIVVVAIGCIFTGPRKSTATNTKIFSDKIALENIVIKNKLGKEVTVGAEYFSEVIKWTQGFTYGKKCTDPSKELTNEYYITVNYVDGTSITSGIDFAEKDGEQYYVERKDLPEYWGYITRKINTTIGRTRIDVYDDVRDIFESGSPVSMSADAIDGKSYETYRINDQSYMETLMDLFDGFEYTRIIKPDTENRTVSITLTSADGTKAMSFWEGEKDIVVYDDGKSIRYWSTTLKYDKSITWLTLADILYNEYASFITNYTRIAFASSGGAREAANLFAHKIYKEQTYDRVPPGVRSIKDYSVVHWGVIEVSEDGRAIVGWMEYAVIPEYPDLHEYAAGSTVDGEGDYKGWQVEQTEFVLQKQSDGLWRCIEMSTGGCSLPD